MSATGAMFILGDADRTEFVRDEASCTFNLTSQQPGLSTLQLVFPPGEDPFVPACGWHYEIFETFDDSDPVRVFAGLVEDLEVGFISDDGWHTITLSAASLEKMLDAILVPESTYTQVAAQDIVTTLMSNAASQFVRGVAIGTIVAPTLLTRAYDGKTSLWQALTQIATDAACVVYIDPADVGLYMHGRTQRISPFTITSPDILEQQDGSSTIRWKQSKSDFRNLQSIQLSALTLPADTAIFDGDGGTTQFTLPNPARQVIGAALSTAVAATGTGTFADLPSDGDVVSIISFYSPPIAPPDYTFVDTLDNTVYGQVLIGVDINACASNLADAINGKPSTAGIAYSSATFGNQQVTASASGAVVTVKAKTLGTQGNTIGLATTAINFSWGADTMAGGAVGVTLQLTVAALGSASADLYYTPGTPDILTQVAPDSGAKLVVNYYRPTGNQINGGNNFNVDFNIGTSWASMHPRDVLLPADAIQQMGAVLAAYSTLPAQFSFQTFKTGIQPGVLQLVDLEFPLFSAALLNGNWLVQEVQAEWIGGIENASDPMYRHFRYTPNFINSTEVSNYVDMFQQVFSPTPIDPPPLPAVPPVVTTPSAGSQWVQETLRPVSAVSGTDLVVDDILNTVVTSGSYTFVSGDVGSRLNIGLTTGWTPGEYLILSVLAGAATLNNSPAAVSTTGGHWSLFNGTAYELTWSPIVSDWTHNQIVILTILVAADGSSHVLTPFKFDEQGFVIVGPPDVDTGPQYQLTGNRIDLDQATDVGDVLLAVYFPEGVPSVANTNPHGDDLVADGGHGDFGRWVSSESHCFTSEDTGKILRVTGGDGWSPDDYLITDVGTGDLLCFAALEFSPADSGATGGIWELIG